MPDRAALIVALILERPMCLDCIASKSGLGAADVDTTMATVRAALQLHVAQDRCRACGATTSVFSFDRPSV